MAFRANVRTDTLRPDAPIAVYVTRGAFGNPPRDEAQIAAVGCVGSPIVEEPLEVAGQRYQRWCDLQLEAVAPCVRGYRFDPW
jgi:hypothetical protein